MRELKFRAWAKYDNVMSLPFALSDARMHFTPIGGTFAIVADVAANTDDWIVMQSTGLRDKNGVEIYEGDVLAIADTYTEPIDDFGGGPEHPIAHIVPVVYNERLASFGVIMEDNNGDTYLYSSGFTSFGDISDGDGLGDVEVIGNIYTNPELLKVQA